VSWWTVSRSPPTSRGCPSHRSVGVPGISWNLAGPLDAGQRLSQVFKFFRQDRPLHGGFSHFNTMSKIVCRLLGYNTTVKCYFPGRLPRSFLLLFFRQTLAVWENAVVPKGVRGICWMTCQKESKRLTEPIGNLQRAICVAASKGL
jgi:hypothetical protein